MKEKSDNTGSVSLIAPMFLCENCVESFLESMCAQEHKNIEIICVIDGSPDGTLDKVSRYAQQDPRIKVISIEHGGAGAARNAGMAEARGEYLMFPDADDSFRPDYVSSLLNTIVSKQADVAVSRYTIHDGYLNKHFSFGFDPAQYRGDRVYSSDELIDPFVSISNVVHNKIFKRSFIVEHGLHFMEHFITAFFRSAGKHSQKRCILNAPQAAPPVNETDGAMLFGAKRRMTRVKSGKPTCNKQRGDDHDR